MSQELMISDTGILARAELDMQISTAKAYPRNISQCVDNAEALATMDESTAQSCFYCLPRKDKEGNKKEMTSASIRLAEIVASSWGNLHAATRIVENDGRHITSEACAWDLEKNVKITVQSKVSIWFGEKNGKGGYQANSDMQTVLSNAASAKALRNAIFKVVPKALVDRVLAKAMRYIPDHVAVNVNGVNPDRVKELVNKLTGMGVNLEKMLAYYEIKDVLDINQEIFTSLKGVGTAIKEGHIKSADVFSDEKDPESNLTAAQTVNNLLNEKKQNEVKHSEETTNDNNGGASPRFFK